MENNTTEMVQEVKPRKKLTGLFIGLGSAALAAILAVGGAALLYSSGQKHYDLRQYEEARDKFEVLGFLPAYGEKVTECDYALAGEYVAQGKYLEAGNIYLSISDYKDSKTLCKRSLYMHAEKLMEEELYEAAREAFLVVKDYEDAEERADEAWFAQAEALLKEGKLPEAREIFLQLGTYEGAAERVRDCDLHLAVSIYRQGEYEDALDIFSDYAGESKKAEAYANLCLFGMFNQTGAELEKIYMLYDLLAEGEQNSDVEAALAHPFFYAARFFGAGWETENGFYSLDADYENMTIYHDVPWDSSGDEDIYFVNDEEGCNFTIGEKPWFTITGFDSYDELHPQKMYVEDAEGHEYTMVKYTEFAEE